MAMETKIVKTFFEKETGQFFNALSAARKAHPDAYIYRVWVDEHGHILSQRPIVAFGKKYDTVASADKSIAEELKNQQSSQK